MVQELVDYKELFELGIREFNSGDYFACHDTFESIWMDTRGEHRRFLQGMIQSSVGIYHGLHSNLRGAYSQTDKALQKLRDYPARYAGIDLESFRDAVQVLHDSIRESLLNNTAEFDSSLVPSIQTVEEDSLLVLEW